MRPDFDQIKKTTDIAAVIQRYGIELKKQGNDYVGLCPFHQDKRPSLRVTPSKGLFHCMACGAAGNVIQFVAKKEGITDKAAALKLTGSIPGIQRGSELVKPAPTAPAHHPELLAAILDHYHQTLLGRNRRGLDYLKGRGLTDVAMLAHFKVGFVDGTLKSKLTPAQVKLAQDMGVFNDKRNERYFNRVVVPILDETGQPVGVSGRDITGQMQQKYLNLDGPQRGVWNSGSAAAYPDELIVTEGIFDGLALWQAGIKNSIAICGVEGWSALHTALIQKHSVRKVVLALDQDEAGDRGVKKVTSALTPLGVKVHRLHWPEGINDACHYFEYNRTLDFKGTREGFAALVTSARQIGMTRAAATSETPSLKVVEKTAEGVVVQNGTINYRIKGMSSQGALKIVLTARKDDLHHVDHLDLYTNKARKMFSTAAAERLSVEPQKVEDDLLALLDLLEKLRAADEAAPSTPALPTMSEAEREEALKLLQSPRLLDRIAADLEIVGYVGEPRNKKIAYLIGTSRLLPKPLSGIFRAQSGSGKSFLMECVAELTPPEQVHYFSRLTPQALYYLEPDALTHKLLIVDERDGSEEAEYSIRTLQTSRTLKLAVPIKDPNSGKIKTVVLEIHGPIAYMESTTAQQINDENANRCFELYLDESEKQTRAIFAAQRRARTLGGWRSERQKEKVLRLHHNAQRLLRPLKVIIPYVELIEYPASWLRGRRDNDRFLSLIEGIAFLHQHQRRIGLDHDSEYIEASLEDYAHAYDLAHQVFAEAGSDLPKHAADFLDRMGKAMRQLARENKSPLDAFTFSRRDVREALRQPDHIVKRTMRQLEELEYVQVQRAANGGSFRYRLTPGETPSPLDGLLTPEALAAAWKDRDNQDKTGTR
jgi:DNA primase catalytic core